MLWEQSKIRIYKKGTTRKQERPFGNSSKIQNKNSIGRLDDKEGNIFRKDYKKKELENVRDAMTSRRLIQDSEYRTIKKFLKRIES